MPRILHFGLGNFHRAHQAWYTARAGGDWKITGVSLRSAGVRDAMQARDFAYTLVTKSVDATDFETLSVIDDVLVGSEDSDAILACLVHADTAVVSVTVTEKGYFLAGASGDLIVDDPLIAADLQSARAAAAADTDQGVADESKTDEAGADQGEGERGVEIPPATLIGFLCIGLYRRQQAGAPALTIMSCDNLSSNGQRLAGAVRQFAMAAEMPILDYLDASVTFPDAMVDRITPATTPALCEEVRTATGNDDPAPVVTEAFSEWVIEDRFAGPRPAWETVGATLVQDVTPFELRKLRLLNGSHSLIAYLGMLRGHEYVHQAVADPVIAIEVAGIMEEGTSTLPASSARDAADYREALLKRFSNPSLHHALAQIGMDGTQKLPIRVLSTLNARRRQGLASEHACMALASWAAFAVRESRGGVSLNDPQSESITKRVAAAADDAGAVLSVLSLLADVALDEADRQQVVDGAVTLLNTALSR